MTTEPAQPDPAAGLRFNDAGLVCAVVQQYDTKEVLMVAWMCPVAWPVVIWTVRMLSQ